MYSDWVAAFSILELLFLFWVRFDCVDHEKKSVNKCHQGAEKEWKRERVFKHSGSIRRRTKQHRIQKIEKEFKTGNREREKLFFSQTYIAIWKRCGKLVICIVNGFVCCSTARHVCSLPFYRRSCTVHSHARVHTHGMCCVVCYWQKQKQREIWRNESQCERNALSLFLSEYVSYVCIALYFYKIVSKVLVWSHYSPY